jgi:hypothetical protein
MLVGSVEGLSLSFGFYDWFRLIAVWIIGATVVLIDPSTDSIIEPTCTWAKIILGREQTA